MFYFGKSIFINSMYVCADQTYSDKLRNRKGNEMTGKRLFTFQSLDCIFNLETFYRFREVPRDGEGSGDSSKNLLPARRRWRVSSGGLRRLIEIRAREFSILCYKILLKIRNIMYVHYNPTDKKSRKQYNIYLI